MAIFIFSIHNQRVKSTPLNRSFSSFTSVQVLIPLSKSTQLQVNVLNVKVCQWKYVCVIRKMYFRLLNAVNCPLWLLFSHKCSYETVKSTLTRFWGIWTKNCSKDKCINRALLLSCERTSSQMFPTGYNQRKFTQCNRVSLRHRTAVIGKSASKAEFNLNKTYKHYLVA